MSMEDRILRQQEIACGETCADYCERIEEVSDERDALQERVELLETSVKILMRALVTATLEIEELQAQPE
jgi:hypothetical protein